MSVDVVKEHSRKKPIFLFRLDNQEYESLQATVKGMTEFTAAINHSLLNRLKTPCVALILASNYSDGIDGFIGIVKSKSAVTTLESRISIRRVSQISIASERELVEQIGGVRFQRMLQKHLDTQIRGIALSPALSAEIITSLWRKDTNTSALMKLSELLKKKVRHSGNSRLQEDAVHTALKIFGLNTDPVADALELQEASNSTLSGIRIREDAVIEHDGKSIPGMSLIKSSVTGRAIFSDDTRRLEVITANKRPLEEVLGVDLIYINQSLSNVVMVQYKMLDREGTGENTRWVYRPDNQLTKELDRMKALATKRPQSSAGSYRLNPQAFYIKLIKRDSNQAGTSVTVPLDHFELMMTSPDHRGLRGGILIDYKALEGRYLRSASFIDLVQCGYIGSHDEEINGWNSLVEILLDGNRAVVTAIQNELHSQGIGSASNT
ncbi:hypothetical protein QGP82_16635 [Leptothoe sp. LEGE 181152]|nr:hypothetical protein [Leptothoe sp. LEGE 181152]